MANKKKLVKRSKKCSYKACAAHLNFVKRKRKAENSDRLFNEKRLQLVKSEHDEIIVSTNENCSAFYYKEELRAMPIKVERLSAEEGTDGVCPPPVQTENAVIVKTEK